MDLIIKIAENRQELDDVSTLFWQYGKERTFDKALMGYAEEIAGLPGKYGPPEGLLLIGYIRSQPAGCIAFQKLSNQVCEMKRLYVAPEFRGLGLGYRLIQRLLKAAVSHGYQTMKLDSHPNMLIAQKLYKKFDFVPTVRYNQNPIEGIIFFEKDLQ